MEVLLRKVVLAILNYDVLYIIIIVSIYQHRTSDHKINEILAFLNFLRVSMRRTFNDCKKRREEKVTVKFERTER